MNCRALKASGVYLGNKECVKAGVSPLDCFIKKQNEEKHIHNSICQTNTHITTMFPSSPRTTMFLSSSASPRKSSLNKTASPPKIIFIYAAAAAIDSDDISCCSMDEMVRCAAERRWSADVSESSASHDFMPSMPRRS